MDILTFISKLQTLNPKGILDHNPHLSSTHSPMTPSLCQKDEGVGYILPSRLGLLKVLEQLQLAERVPCPPPPPPHTHALDLCLIVTLPYRRTLFKTVELVRKRVTQAWICLLRSPHKRTPSPRTHNRYLTTTNFSLLAELSRGRHS